MTEIYLDNASTTRPSPAVREVMLACLEEAYGNPSSLHRTGVEAENIIKKAQGSVAELRKVREKEIFFTSGGTESNNWAVLGAARARKRQGRHVITSAVEHPSVSAPMAQLKDEGFELTVLPVDSRGLVDPEDLKAALRPDTVLVSLMAVNNELGSIEPIEACGAEIRRHGGVTAFHVR